MMSEQEKSSIQISQGTFYPVAALALSQGFRITGVISSLKRPRPYAWQKHPFENLVDVKSYAMEHPDDKVGIFLIRGVGLPFVWDIDADGVLERMERETGRTLPRTRVVQSRPQSKSYKRHIYFLQTEHSVSEFGHKNKNVEKVSANGEFVTIYDLKGIGGAAQVVAEGSMREDGGEKYTAIDADAEMVPIPDWLVDWLCEDARKHKSEVDKARYQKRLETAKALASRATHVDWRAIMRTRISSYAGLQIEPKDREMLCLKQIQKHCGEATASDPKVRASVHKAAHNPNLKMGDLPVVQKYAMVGTCITTVTSRHTKWVEVVEKFPAEISSADAERMVSAACEYRKDDASHRSELSKVRKEVGFMVDKKTNVWRKEVV
jgi:hypothetical protein